MNRRILRRLELHDVPPHVWAAALAVAVLAVAGVMLARVIAENYRAPLILPEPTATVTVTCPAPRNAEALVITVGRHGECHVYTGRAH